MILVLSGLLRLDWCAQHLWSWPARSGAWTSPVIIGLPLAIVCALLMIFAFREVAHLAAGAGVQVLWPSGLAATCAIGLLPFWWQLIPSPFSAVSALLVIGLAVMLVFGEQMFRYRIEDAIRRIACTLLAVCYLGFGTALIFSIRQLYGVEMFLLFLVAAKFTDIGAYFTGSAIGKHKLIPWLSPGKTWEGLAGGIITAAGMCCLVAWIISLCSTGVSVSFSAAVFGAIVGATGQFGDLCESLMKRAANLKDSGAVVPEFGGLLDILDSLLLSAPVAVLLLQTMWQLPLYRG